jgi:hypothetical protein
VEKVYGLADCKIESSALISMDNMDHDARGAEITREQCLIKAAFRALQALLGPAATYGDGNAFENLCNEVKAIFKYGFDEDTFLAIENPKELILRAIHEFEIAKYVVVYNQPAISMDRTKLAMQVCADIVADLGKCLGDDKARLQAAQASPPQSLEVRSPTSSPPTRSDLAQLPADRKSPPEALPAQSIWLTMVRSGGPVIVFLDRIETDMFNLVDGKPNFWPTRIRHIDLYKAFCRWCATIGLRPMSIGRFMEKVSEVLPYCTGIVNGKKTYRDEMIVDRIELAGAIRKYKLSLQS